MPVFVDTSSLVKFYYPEPDSERIETFLLESDHIYISNLTVVEVASALARKVRTGDLKKEQETVIWNTFLDDLQIGQIEVLNLNERDYLRAADLIREFGGRYGIKTLDSLQLSMALGLNNAKFLCSDRSLIQIALKIGIKLLTIR